MENAEEELKRKLGWGFFFSRCRGKMQKEYKQSGTWGTKIILFSRAFCLLLRGQR